MAKNQDNEKTDKTPIIVALIGLLGIVIVALINNVGSWRKDSPTESAQPIQQNPEQSNDERENGDTQIHPSPSNRGSRLTPPSIDLFPISGRIEDENGTGLKGVQVSTMNIKARSDEQGRFEINLPFKSMTDELILTFEKEGFETYYQSFNRSQSQLTLPITLKKKN